MSSSRAYLIYSTIVILVAVVLALAFWYNESVLWSFFPEFIAGLLSGILGIVLGFEINRRHEANQRESRIDFILKYMRDEMQLNYGDLTTLKDRVKSGEPSDLCYTLLRTNTWDKFGSQLDYFKDLQFVLSLGYYYDELNHLKEAIGRRITVEGLKNFYAYYPPFEGINDLLEHLIKSSVSFQHYLEKYLFEKT